MEVVHNPRFAETETTPPSDTTTGGLGLPGLDHPTRGTPDMNQLIPAISLMMQSFLSNPQYMKQIIDQNPQLHDYIPQLREMMQNPEVVRQLTLPQMMQIIDHNPQLHDYIPQLREMMQNPEVVRQLTLPQMMQQMMSSQLLPELNQQSPLQREAYVDFLLRGFEFVDNELEYNCCTTSLP
ncbi:ubiquitin domain-containing protein DSK2a [Artemisia annua]|uniref:Ubiquitin domain-containing protein DSK2a n=1 Tax=Artemisia annua TaxID=35608 RepID=A0A2U1QJM1_ARTAN|nr:ubiquitin domain-containing protein DSK2a [Artemisia annua]